MKATDKRKIREALLALANRQWSREQGARKESETVNRILDSCGWPYKVEKVTSQAVTLTLDGAIVFSVRRSLFGVSVTFEQAFPVSLQNGIILFWEGVLN